MASFLFFLHVFPSCFHSSNGLINAICRWTTPIFKSLAYTSFLALYIQSPIWHLHLKVLQMSLILIYSKGIPWLPLPPQNYVIFWISVNDTTIHQLLKAAIWEYSWLLLLCAFIFMSNFLWYYLQNVCHIHALGSISTTTTLFQATIISCLN